MMMEYPIPLDLDYTVTASARINQHISQISGALTMGRLHPRFAQVACPGGTIRRLEVLGVTRANGVETDKRIFRQIYQVRIPPKSRRRSRCSSLVSQPDPLHPGEGHRATSQPDHCVQ